MKRIAKFHKVSEEQFLEGWKDAFGDTEEAIIKSIYENIKLPKRATAGSAGYDFFSPVDFELRPGETLKMPTGIRAEMDLGWVLKIYPRSGLGFKYRLQLNNTVGIIDSDYFYSDNEGHIFIKITNDSNEGKTVQVAAGTGFAQGIFLEYGITEDDDATAVRNGGLGSTTKSKGINPLLFRLVIFTFFSKFCFCFQICNKIMERFCSSHVLVFPFNVGNNRIIIFFSIAEQISFASGIFSVFV